MYFSREVVADVPAMLEMFILLFFLKRVSQNQQQVDVVLNTLFLRYMLEQIFFRDNASKFMKKTLQLTENGFFLTKAFRTLNAVESVVLDLANSLAGNTVFLANRFKRHLSRIFVQTVTAYDNIASPFR